MYHKSSQGNNRDVLAEAEAEAGVEDTMVELDAASLKTRLTAFEKQINTNQVARKSSFV